MLRDQTITEESAAAEQDEPRELRLEHVSAGLRAALERAEPGPSGLRSVRAIGPQGQRYTAGLYEEKVFLLELPWPNPRNECRPLHREPTGVDWQPHRSG
jgi:hypothetical protein